MTAVGVTAAAIEIALCTVLAFGHVKLDTPELQSQVQANITESFAKDPRFSALHVDSFQLVHVQGNQYRGLLQVSSAGDSEQLPVNVTYDGSRFLWQIAQ